MPIGLLSVQSLVADLLGGQPTYTVVDARPLPEFERGHIPGARAIAWEDWCEKAPVGSKAILHEPGYWGALAHPLKERFGERLALAGICHDKPIVVYADSARSKGREGRLAWMLLYLGATEVYMLNGGWGGWLEASAPVERETTFRPSTGSFRLSLAAGRRAELSVLSQCDREGKMPLAIDTRTPAEFHGDCYDYQPRKGRLPNSILFPFASLFEDDGSFVSKERYLAIVPPDILDTPRKIAYCEVGVRASTYALLHEIYTGEIMPVYDGSFMEWGWHVDLPVIA